MSKPSSLNDDVQPLLCPHISTSHRAREKLGGWSPAQCWELDRKKVLCLFLSLFITSALSAVKSAPMS